MSRFLSARATIVSLLVAILVLVIGISAVMASGSSSSSSTGVVEGRLPSLRAEPLQVVVPDCKGTAHFDVFAAGYEDGDIVLITLRTAKGQRFIGSGRPNQTGGFMDDISVSVEDCGVLTLQAKRGEEFITTPVAIVESK